MKKILPILNLFKCPEQSSAVFVRLILLALLICLVLVANPGFYSHDELEKVDHILRYGFADYFKDYVTLKPGEGFAFAVRPVAYFVEGVVSLFFHKYPFLIHMTDVLMHAIVAYLLFIAALRLSGNRKVAWAGALIFLANPLVSFSVGWSGALMDRLYLLFGLLAFIAAHNYIKREGGVKSLVAVFAASLMAMLSKETALILPLTLLAFPLFSVENIKSKRLWAAFGVWAVPVLLFMLYRLPELIASFTVQSASPYSASVAHVPQGIFVYFIYPFLPFLTESHNWALQSPAFIGIAVVGHLALLAVLWLAFSYRAVLAYLFGYVLFLIPILFIPGTGSHYLYGSGIAFSLGIGALLAMEREHPQKTLLRAIPLVLLAIAVLHTLLNQQYFYKTGLCMDSVENTVESAYLADGKPDSMSVLINPDAPGHVLARFLHNKEMIGSYFPVKFQVVSWEQRQETKYDYIFNCDCLVHKLEPFKLAVKNWGPQSTPLNVIPNQQPDGSGALWIEVPDTKDVGELQVMIGGQAATLTSIQPQVITAAFPPELFSQPGEKEIAIKKVATGQVLPIGRFVVEPAR
jgi:hypothetical protein